MNENERKQKEQMLFMQLLITFQSAAWQEMGKMKNPITDKIERNLEQARYSIDMLEMIRHRTQGNLEDNEKRFLETIIRDLQLNFVDEVEKDNRASGKKAPEEKSAEEGKKTEEKSPAGDEAETQKTPAAESRAGKEPEAEKTQKAEHGAAHEAGKRNRPETEAAAETGKESVKPKHKKSGKKK